MNDSVKNIQENYFKELFLDNRYQCFGYHIRYQFNCFNYQTDINCPRLLHGFTSPIGGCFENLILQLMKANYRDKKMFAYLPDNFVTVNSWSSSRQGGKQRTHIKNNEIIFQYNPSELNHSFLSRNSEALLVETQVTWLSFWKKDIFH